jgi:hypothetical protein
MLRWLKTVVVSDDEEAYVMRQVGARKTIIVEVSKSRQTASEPRCSIDLGMSLRMSADWPGGVRHDDDVSLACRFRVEREKARRDTDCPGQGGEREPPKRPKPRGNEYRCVDALADPLVVAVKPL